MFIAFLTHTYLSSNSNVGTEICYVFLRELKRKGIKVSLSTGLPIVIHKNDSINQTEFINEYNYMIKVNFNQIINKIYTLNEKH